MRKIEIDDDVWNCLKTHAIPFEDSPNTVLRKILLGDNNTNNSSPKTVGSNKEMPIFPNDIPSALQQILEVVFLVKLKGLTRSKATNEIAKKRNIAPQTVIDKYCRQLNKKAHEIDRVLEFDLNQFKSILIDKFDIHKEYINEFFEKYFEEIPEP
ncbi:MAG: hypothetical protein JXB48_12545 [Candidatus Latescibacteria bacterium]|nr:hypothetical protein [Candidatus Latescibacterota bacterium]